MGRGLGRSRSRRLPRSQMRLPSLWKGKVGHTGDLGECRGGTAGGALGSDDMAGSLGSSVLGSGGWAAGERMPRSVGLLLVTWRAKGAGVTGPSLCFWHNLLSGIVPQQPAICGSRELPHAASPQSWTPTSSTGNCPRKPVLAWSRLGCSRKSIPREQPGLFNLSIARIIPHI